MKHRALDSSHLESAAYSNGTLEVAFKDGSRYRYFNVPPHIAAHLMDADSPGAYLKSTIIGYYRTQRLR